MVSFILKVNKNIPVTSADDLFMEKPDGLMMIRDENLELTLWGDPITGKNFRELFLAMRTAEYLLENVSGHFYFLLIEQQGQQITVGNSLFSLLPLYYHERHDSIFFSDNAIRLGRYCGLTKLSIRFVTELVLFNYPLSGQSVVEGIQLLESSSCCRVEKGRITTVRHFYPESLFVRNPLPWKQAAKEVAESFLATVEKYLPEEPYFTSLTGGFDGRTLAAAGLFHNRKFNALCFGTETSADLHFARIAARDAGISLEEIMLDDSFINGHSLELGREFIFNSSGTGTFERAHYLFAASRNAARGGFLVTGNFGSEILRAAHVTGEMISRNLFHLFNADNADTAFRMIQASSEFSALNHKTVSHAWEEIKSDLHNLPSFASGYTELTRNQRFYIFVFDEIFRKYFGAEIINQFGYVKNRTPFLDLSFLKVLFRTGLAGAYSEFYENNPLRRYKGQVLYGEIIRHAFPALGRTLTGKGYRPDDLLSAAGKVRIVNSFIRKKLIRPADDADPNGVSRAWENNKHYWVNLLEACDIVNPFFAERFRTGMAESIVYRLCTVNYLNNLLNENQGGNSSK